MYYAVLDTNVIVSAMLKARSKPGEVVVKALSGNITPLLNHKILDEYNEVLRRKKFRFREEIISAVVSGIIERAIFIDTDFEILDEIFPDPKDIVFYKVVMEARKKDEAYLVTGNIKHFPVRSYVVTPAQMLDIISTE